MVDVGGVGVGVAVAANPIDIVVLASEPENVGRRESLRSGKESGPREEGQEPKMLHEGSIENSGGRAREELFWTEFTELRES